MKTSKATIVSYDSNNWFWKVVTDEYSLWSPFYLRQQDFDYNNPQEGDKVEVYYAESGMSRIYRARRTA
jgi:hypothetical protein